MECLEYLNKITDFGTRAILPREVTEQQSITMENDGQTSNGVTVVKYTTESLSEEKKVNRLIEQISMLVLNTQKDKASVKRFRDHCMRIVPRDFQNGEYDKTAWTEFLLSMALSISAQLTRIVIKERHWKGADTLLKVLTTRIEAWNTRVEVTSDDEGKVATVTFERF